MNYEEFRREILGLNRSRKHKVQNSYGVYDAFKYYRKVKSKDKKYILTESQYFSIIRSVNNLLAQEILKGEDIILPNRMGKLELRKKPTTVKIVNDKLVTNMPIDWDATLRLWAEDEDSYKKRTLIKIEEKEIFFIIYNKHFANYKNKTYYQFSVNKQLKKNLKDVIKQKQIDAFELWRNSSKV